MNREKLAWTVSLVLIGILAFSIPGTLAQRDDDYSFVRTLVDIHRQVAANYVDSVDESKLRQGAIDGMLGELDPFSVYVPPANQEAFDRMLEGSFKGVGILLNQNEDGKLEVVTPIDGSPAAKAGVMAGDIILKVNGESIEGLRMNDAQKKIGGPLGTQVKLTVKHESGEEAELTMTREEVVMPTIKGYSRNTDNSWDYYVVENPKIAYVRISQFTPDTHENLRKVLDNLTRDGMNGLILDLRFNPGGRLDQALQILDMLIDHGTLLVTKGRNRPESRIEASGSGTLPRFPMIVLVNEHSASASEIVAGSLQDNHRAVVIGTRSYGKGSVQEVIPLEGKSGELKLTVAYYYLPSGRLVHRKKDATDWGVQPTIVVPMDTETQRKVFTEMGRSELFRRPIKLGTAPSTPTTSAATGASTQSGRTQSAATQAAATQAAGAQPMLDSQLQRAVDTLVATVVLQGQPHDGGAGGTPVAQVTRSGSPLPSTRQFVPENPDSTAPPSEVPSTRPSSAPAAKSVPTTAPAPGEAPASAPAPAPAPSTNPSSAPAGAGHPKN